MNFLELEIDGTRYAITLESVDRVIPRVWLSPLAAPAPADVEGLFALDGHTAVAINGRARLGHAHRPIALEDQMVVLRAPGDAKTVGTPRLALIVDQVHGVRAIDPRSVEPPPLPHPRLEGAVVLEDGLILALDTGALLSEGERRLIARAIEETHRATPSDRHPR